MILKPTKSGCLLNSHIKVFALAAIISSPAAKRVLLCLISGKRGRNVHDISFEEVKGKAKGAGETSQQQVLSDARGRGKGYFS